MAQAAYDRRRLFVPGVVGRKKRKLRIAFSVACGIVCLLLNVFRLRSCWLCGRGRYKLANFCSRQWFQNSSSRLNLSWASLIGTTLSSK